MDYRTQKTTEEDLTGILQLNQAAMPAVSSLSHSELLGIFLEADHCRSLCAQGKIAGFLICLGPGKSYQSPNYQWFRKRYECFLYVDRIVIDVPHQGMGMGKILYDEMREFARPNYSHLTCEINLRPPNEGSMVFHQRYGFRQVGSQNTEGGEKKVALMEYKI